MTIHTNHTQSLLSVAKWAFTTRRVNPADAVGMSQDFSNAKAGDLVLCQILQIGQHKNIQLSNRRTSASYPGDYVVLCLGDRYAPDQFLCRAEISNAPMQLAAGGGIVGTVEASHQKMKTPTSVQPIGVLKNADGKTLNVGDYAQAPLAPNNDITVIGVFGASMNSGKTTAAVSLAHGLKNAGYNVAGIKATGTGAFGDFHAFEDAGINVTDFTDAGMATTYKMPMSRIEAGFETLVATAASKGAEVAVVEIADGVFQQETKKILKASRIRDRLDGILFAAPDALSAYGGVTLLEGYGLSPFAISGMVRLSPLATAEAAEVTGLPILTREHLWDPNVVQNTMGQLMRNPELVAA